MSDGGGNDGGSADGPGIITLSVWAAAAMTVLAVVLGPQVGVLRQCPCLVFRQSFFPLIHAYIVSPDIYEEEFVFEQALVELVGLSHLISGDSG